MAITLNLGLSVFTCAECGSFYGVPEWLHNDKVVCPICCGKIIRDLRSNKMDLQGEIVYLNNQIRGLKAAFKRFKNKT